MLAPFTLKNNGTPTIFVEAKTIIQILDLHSFLDSYWLLFGVICKCLPMARYGGRLTSQDHTRCAANSYLLYHSSNCWSVATAFSVHSAAHTNRQDLRTALQSLVKEVRLR